MIYNIIYIIYIIYNKWFQCKTDTMFNLSNFFF